NRNARSTIITFTHLVNLLIYDCNTISGGWNKIKGSTAFYRIIEACSRLSLPKSTLEAWVRAAGKGTLCEIGKSQRPLTDVEFELARVKKELARVTMERDLLKKAAAYFARESLPGTR
ncbi:MAG: hypothetical protein PHF56_23255, partial [Desulfuromonadaceae bacterium]|nr:hypothetical protein [Desulfuromonadaceae bacterium]